MNNDAFGHGLAAAAPVAVPQIAGNEGDTDAIVKGNSNLSPPKTDSPGLVLAIAWLLAVAVGPDAVVEIEELVAGDVDDGLAVKDNVHNRCYVAAGYFAG